MTRSRSARRNMQQEEDNEVLRHRDPNVAADVVDENEEDEMVLEEETNNDSNENDEQDEEQTRSRSRRHGDNKSKKKKKKKVVVMRDSQQTDEERRILRQQQRALQRDIATTDELENPQSNALKQVRFANNELWDNVKYVREAVLDGDNLEMLSNRAVKQTNKLDETSGIRYDVNDVIRKLVTKCTSNEGYFDWNMLGIEAGACFNTVPDGVTFLQGPINDDTYVPKERKQRPKRSLTEEDNSEEIKAEEVQTLKKDADALSAVEKHIKTIHKTLQTKATAKCQSTLEKLDSIMNENDDMKHDEDLVKKKQRLEKKGVESICAVQCLFNPKSFTQTVENIFHFSFLVKQGNAAIDIGETTEATQLNDNDNEDDKEEESSSKEKPIGPRIIPKLQRNTMPESRQAIVKLDMSDWRQMCQAYNVTKSDVPHRTGSKHTKK